MDRKMADRRLIRLSQVPERLTREKLEDSDWVTFGVLVNKVTPQSNSSVGLCSNLSARVVILWKTISKLSQKPSKIAFTLVFLTHFKICCVLLRFWLSASSLQGKTFSIWKLNDLHNLEVFVSLLLFGEVHKEHWKTEPGTVIGLLNPNPMKQKDGYDGVSGQSELNITYIQ